MKTETELSEIKIESSYKSIDELRPRIGKDEKRIDKIKKRTIELLEVSSANGLPNIFRSRNMIISIIWLIFTILSAIAGSYFVIKSILDYLKYSTVTKIEVIHEKQVPFPAVSICAYPSFNSSLNETVLFNRFNDILLINDSNIYYEEFTDILMGKCFRFNSGRNSHNQSYDIINSTIGGLKYGLKLNMKIKVQDEYDNSEIRLFIHNQSLPPYDASNSQGYWLATGSWNYFEIDRVFHQRLDAPYSDCLKNFYAFKKNKTLIDQILKENRDYNQNNCYYLCSHLFALERSNCSCNSSLNDFSKNCIRSLNKKEETDVQKCNAKYLTKFREYEQYEKCSEYCPLECDSLSYVINNYPETISTNGNISKVPKKDYYPDFNNYEEVKKSFLAIRVYYNELKYTLIREEPETESFIFVSNIGGILGLFLGISFLSFIEIFEIILEILIIFFQKN